MSEPTMADAAEMLWVVLANVSGGDWTKQSAEWQAAAARWRDCYLAALHEHVAPDERSEEAPSREALAHARWIAEREDYTFAECTLAEEIVARAKRIVALLAGSPEAAE